MLGSICNGVCADLVCMRLVMTGTEALSWCLQMVELASDKFVCIVDDTKLVEGIGGSKGGPSPNCIALPEC